MTPTYRDLRAARICVTCRKAPSPDKAQCSNCRGDRADRRRSRLVAGQCTRCPCPALVDSEFCEACRDEKNAANLRWWNKRNPLTDERRAR